MAGIFINYRRDDSSGVAGRLFDYLAARFSKDDLFMDVDAMKPGMDFAKQPGCALFPEERGNDASAKPLLCRGLRTTSGNDDALCSIGGNRAQPTGEIAALSCAAES